MLNLRVGHVLEVLRTLPDESVHCVVTSPPFYGLRAYRTEPQVWGGEVGHEHTWNQASKKSIEYVQGNPEFDRPHREHKSFSSLTQTCSCGSWRGELGLEPTPELYVQHLVEVFQEVKRVLRSDGSLWLNLGYSYAGSWGNRSHRPETKRLNRFEVSSSTQEPPTAHPEQYGFKPKDLIDIPHFVSEALRQDGWWLRSAITLCKLNPMPESVTDRPTSATEMMFLMTKSERYYYDQEAIREPLASSSIDRILQSTFDQQQGGPRDYGHRTNANRSARKALCNLKEKLIRQEKWGDRYEGWNQRNKNIGRNLRNWWVITTEPFPKSLTDDPSQSHFATFGQKWIEPCIRAGTSEKGCCATCGAPWERIIERGQKIIVEDRGKYKTGGLSPDDGMIRAGAVGRMEQGKRYKNQTIGWHPTCSCDAKTIPCTVLDPFVGSGTTCLVSLKLGRRSIGIDLKPEYIAMSYRRIEQEVPLLARMKGEGDERGIARTHSSGSERDQGNA